MCCASGRLPMYARCNDILSQVSATDKTVAMNIIEVGKSFGEQEFALTVSRPAREFAFACCPLSISNHCDASDRQKLHRAL